MSESITSRAVRQYVDGELGAEEAGLIEQAMAASPLLREQVQFEQRLRDHLGSVMQAEVPSAPPGLIERVRSELAGAEIAGPEVHVIGQIEADVGASSSTTGRRRGWMLPQRINVFAVAATLLLVAGVVLVSIFMPPIDQWRHDRTMASVTDVAEYVSGEHSRCAGDLLIAERKAHYRTAATAEAALHEYLQRPIRVFELDSAALGYRFIGGGECDLPAAERSCHLIYIRQRPGEPPARLSVFIEPDVGQFQECDGCPDWQACECASGTGGKVMFASDGSLVYFLVCCDSGDLKPVAEAIAMQLAQ